MTVAVSILIELNYIFLSLLLMIYSAWRYSRRRERSMLYLTLGFTFLALSTTLQMIKSLIWFYGTQVNILMLRFLELGGLALFACFTISTIIALREISKASSVGFRINLG